VNVNCSVIGEHREEIGLKLRVGLEFCRIEHDGLFEPPVEFDKVDLVIDWRGRLNEGHAAPRREVEVVGVSLPFRKEAE